MNFLILFKKYLLFLIFLSLSLSFFFFLFPEICLFICLNTVKHPPQHMLEQL